MTAPEAAIPDAGEDEEALGRACASGDPEALTELFDRYHRDVYRFLARLLGERSPDVDDLVQATFMQAMRCVRTRGRRSRLRTWLLGVAVNVARNQTRSRRRYAQALQRLEQVPEPRGGDPELATSARQQLAGVQRALDALKPEKRLVFLLCQLEGLSGPEAAEALRLPIGTISRLLWEARRELSVRLGVSR